MSCRVMWSRLARSVLSGRSFPFGVCLFWPWSHSPRERRSERIVLIGTCRQSTFYKTATFATRPPHSSSRRRPSRRVRPPQTRLHDRSRPRGSIARTSDPHKSLPTWIMPAKGNVIPHDGSSDGPKSPVPGVDSGPFHAGSAAAAAATRKDVDHLVQEIKENLKLGHYAVASAAAASSGFKSRSASHLTHRGTHRASPYQVPPTSRAAVCDNGGAVGQPGAAAGSGADPRGPSQLKRWNQRRRYPSTCMSGGKGDPDDPFEMLQELITDGSLIKEAVRRLQLGLTPKLNNRSFYDSDEECRTPPAYPDICCEVGVAGGVI